MAAVRREVLKRLQASVDAQDDAGIVQWGGKRCLAKYPLPQPLAEAIAAARERLGRSESLLTALANAAEGSGEAGGPAAPSAIAVRSNAAEETPRANRKHRRTLPVANRLLANRLRAPCPAAGTLRAVRRSGCAQAERSPTRRFCSSGSAARCCRWRNSVCGCRPRSRP